MAVAGMILLGTLIIVYEAPPLYRQERYRDLLVFLALTALGLTLGILVLLDIPFANPIALIRSVSSFIWKMFGKIGGFFAR